MGYYRCEACREWVSANRYIPRLCYSCYEKWLKDELITKEMKDLGITTPTGISETRKFKRRQALRELGITEEDLERIKK